MAEIRHAAVFGPRPRAGLGLKPRHCAEVMSTRPEIGFFEVHAENYMGAGGTRHRDLALVRDHYPISLHGVGLSIGGEADLDPAHLERIRALCHRYDPIWFSEHLAWSASGGIFLNDLLPIPYDDMTLRRVVRHVDQVQHTLRRTILVENPATYLGFATNAIPEVQFIAELARRTDCGLLLDVNNVHVCSVNHEFDAHAYIDAFPLHKVEEVHLAGFATTAEAGSACLLIDTHDRCIDPAVWALYRYALERMGPRPTLVEWDNEIPTFAELAREARKADRLMLRVASQGRRSA